MRHDAKPIGHRELIGTRARSFAVRCGRHEMRVRLFNDPLADQLSSRFTTA